jgi:hypothetical protein
LQKVEVLLKRIEVQVSGPRRQAFLQQVARRVGEPDAGAAIDGVTQEAEDIIGKFEVMIL